MAATQEGSGRATLLNVARPASVSRQTVSNALHRPEVLSPETLVRVRQSIDELGYQPNRHAQSLRTGESRLIGLRVDQMTPSVVLDRFLHALVDGFRTRGYSLIVFSPADPADPLSGYRDVLGSMSLDAFVLTATHPGDPRPAFLRSRGSPAVFFGRPWGAEDAQHWVDVDGAAGTALAVDHLVALGHRRIAFLGWPAGSAVGDDRRSGWVRALLRHRLPTGPQAAAGEDLDEALAAAGTLLDRAEPPTAVVCASDVLAVGALHSLAERGLRAGRDVAVTGFDDSPVAALLSPGLTSVHQPLEEVASQVVGLLGGLLSAGAATSTTPSSGVLVTPRLVVRASSNYRENA